MPEPEKIEMSYLANRLEIRKGINVSTVLVLGSRASGLFRSRHFYETLQLVSSHDFRQLSRLQQYEKCYSLLTSEKHFSEAELHSILKSSLQKIEVSEADLCIADLILQGYFRDVISANIDELLEQALTMRNIGEIDVRMPKRRSFHQQGQQYICRVSKAFGDLTAQEYTIRERVHHFAKDPEFKEHLEHILAEDMLVVGLDPYWDEELLLLFPAKQGSVWFVNENGVEDYEHLMRLSRGRQLQYITGSEGTYEYFAQQLYRHLNKDIPIHLSRDISTSLLTASQLARDMQQLREEQRSIFEALNSFTSAKTSFFIEARKLSEGSYGTIHNELREISKTLNTLTRAVTSLTAEVQKLSGDSHGTIPKNTN